MHPIKAKKHPQRAILMEQTKKSQFRIYWKKYKSTAFPTESPVFPFPPPYSAFPFLPFSSVRHPGVGYADTRVSACSAPGCQHLRHLGVVTQKTALLPTEIAKRAYRKQRICSIYSTNGSSQSIKPPYLLHPMNPPIPSRTKR